MKKLIEKKLQPMTVLYGLKPVVVEAAIQDILACSNVCHAWFHLLFGRNEKFGEFLLVLTMNDSFLISTKQQSAESMRKRRKSNDWVFAIDSLPVDFMHGSDGCTHLSFDGYSIAYGLDHDHRDFLSVLIPARNLHLLFRDPSSHSTQAWSSRRADVITEAMTINSAMAATSSGDALLDAYFAGA